MNKKTLIKKATLLLEQYKELEDCQRSYDNKNWHCVDVKRRNDYIDIEKLIEKEYRKYKNDLIEFLNDNYIASIYNNWLDIAWEDLNEMALEEKTKFIETENYNNKMILSLGRSGGWACFQEKTNDNVKESLNAIIRWNKEDMADNEMIEEYKNDDESRTGLFNDIAVKLNNIKALINEINDIKNFIDNFNKKLSFKDEIIYRIEEKIEEIEEERKELAENKELFKTDIKNITNKAIERLDTHKKNKVLKNNINRHLIGIIKALKD